MQNLTADHFPNSVMRMIFTYSLKNQYSMRQPSHTLRHFMPESVFTIRHTTFQNTHSLLIT